MSLTRNAEKRPLVKITVGNKWCGCRRWVIHSTIQSKNPANRRLATISIMENSRTIVAKSMEASASRAPTIPNATISTAPMIAAPGRSILPVSNGHHDARRP
jgi:hypothetical protein